ncbi:hypothetical protein JOE44_004373 [Chryseobacterium sp. PvR013]|uniref:PIN domain-containing protein n=1 Tax=Chryseobacterium sp. PvR013 TaxID=2806595 RepID=UPI001AE60871|nr:PIN domain-containing protein [Chryseobacterium sp. PvR013]MBP1167489.1 hypothetical protein [Chryseobacterium sp. PvR013]
MDIILDTNILRTDFFLNSKDFEVIFDYIEKTHSNLILLNIVMQEIEKLYEEELKEKHDAFKRTNFELSRLLAEGPSDLKDIDFEKQKKIFKDNLLEKFQISEYNEVFELENSSFNQIIQRAVNKKRPFRINGVGFKDAVLWESIIEYIRMYSYKDSVIFISNNVKDFADENNKNNLHPLLLEEIKEFETQIYYFSNIKDFIEKHSKHINSISSEWLNTNIDKNLYLEKIKETFEVYEAKEICNWFEKQNPDLKSNGKIKLNRVFFGNSENFYVYEMSNKDLIIKFEHEIETEIEIGFDKKYYYNSFTEGLMELNYIKINLYVTLENISNNISIDEIYFDIIN